MELKPGLKLKAAGTAAEFVVIRAPGGESEITCAGAPLTADGSGSAVPDAAGEELAIGKRYGDESGSVELLCTRSGPGPLVLDGRTLEVRAAKALPASD
ncbi:hypothetical protein GCM10022221_48600 [Actinocorallia aurea]